MEENLKHELINSLLKSDYRDLVEVEFQGNVAVCHNLAQSDIDFVNAVNSLAKAWLKTIGQFGWQLIPFGNNNYGRRLEDGSLGVCFCCKDAKVRKLAPNQGISVKRTNQK